MVSCLDIQSISDLNTTPDELQPEIRKKLGNQAKKRGWYKNVTYGESLGGLLFSHIDSIEKGKTLYQEFKILLDWIDGQ